MNQHESNIGADAEIVRRREGMLQSAKEFLAIRPERANRSKSYAHIYGGLGMPLIEIVSEDFFRNHTVSFQDFLLTAAEKNLAAWSDYLKMLEENPDFKEAEFFKNGPGYFPEVFGLLDDGEIGYEAKDTIEYYKKRLSQIK